MARPGTRGAQHFRARNGAGGSPGKRNHDKDPPIIIYVPEDEAQAFADGSPPIKNEHWIVHPKLGLAFSFANPKSATPAAQSNIQRTQAAKILARFPGHEIKLFRTVYPERAVRAFQAEMKKRRP